MLAVLSTIALSLAPPAPGAGLCDLAVRAEQLDYGSFEDAASLRMPAVRLRVADGAADEACTGRLHGYAQLRAEGESRWELSLILSDGRAWYRTIEAEGDEAPRVLASALANLLAAIEESSIEADASEVELPAELAERAPETEGPGEPPSSGSEPEREPDPEPELGRVILELSPRLSGTVVVGLAPGPGLRGGGGGFGLDLRLPDGLAFGFGLRVATRSVSGVSLTRTRVALGLGAAPRWGRFELPISFAGIVEPWGGRSGGEPVPLQHPPLIGGSASLAPALLVPVGPVWLRIGLALGFEIAVEAAPGALAAAIALDGTSDPILRAGGVELGLGLQLGVWIPVRERR